jgi:hypothetical protein
MAMTGHDDQDDDAVNDVFAALAAPFGEGEIKWREGKFGSIRYITARTVMNRLDDFVGPANWWDEYIPGEHGVMCKLSIRLPGGRVVTKMDAGGYAGMESSEDDEKSGFSDALKRVAVKFGIARYLYNDGVPLYAKHLHSQQEADAQVRGKPPARPVRGTAPDRQPSAGRTPGESQGPPGSGKKPTTGKALFAWVREVEEMQGVEMLRAVNDWGKFHEFPARIVDWSQDQVVRALDYALKRLDEHTGMAQANGDGNDPRTSAAQEGDQALMAAGLDPEKIKPVIGPGMTYARWRTDYYVYANAAWRHALTAKGKTPPDCEVITRQDIDTVIYDAAAGDDRIDGGDKRPGGNELIQVAASVFNDDPEWCAGVVRDLCHKRARELGGNGTKPEPAKKPVRTGKTRQGRKP